VLGGRSAARQPEHRLLLLDLGGRLVGAAVDRVLTIAAAAVIPGAAADAPSRIPAAALLGTGSIDDATFLAVDPAVLLGRLLH
jgi:hypothetical protein